MAPRSTLSVHLCPRQAGRQATHSRPARLPRQGIGRVHGEPVRDAGEHVRLHSHLPGLA